MRSIKINYLLLILPFVLLGASIFSPDAFAVHKVFNENFDTYANGVFPSGWELANDQGSNSCNAQWQVKDDMFGIAINQGSCTTNVVPSDLIWDSLGDNYTFEFDMKFVNGTDHNVAFRFSPAVPTNNWYEIHFQSPNNLTLSRVNPGTYNVNISLPGGYPNGSTYHVKIIAFDNNIKVFINDNLLKDYTSTIDLFPTGKIALRASSGGDPVSETYFDNIVVTHLDATPSASLNVPLFKQTANPWGDDEYDAASLWSPGSQTIGDWGCAMTSAAMVLAYHSISFLPDGTVLDPGSLNSWLKDQPDGYVGSGLVNWLAISRLSKLAKDSGFNPGFAGDALEYSRIDGEDKPQLTTDIEEGRPDILEEPGHFIVAKGINGDTFDINDPLYDRLTLNDGYSNTFSSMGRYIPSQTDLSYLMLVVNQGVDISLVDSSGNPVGDQFIQQPLNNDTSGAPAGPPVKIVYLPNPGSSDFVATLSASSNGPYNLQTLLYDENGNVKINQFQGNLSSGIPIQFLIQFDHDNSDNSVTKKVVTFDTTRQDVIDARANSQINKENLVNDLIKKLNAAEKNLYKDNTNNVAKIFTGFEKKMNKNLGRKILEDAYNILLYDINYLRSVFIQ